MKAAFAPGFQEDDERMARAARGAFRATFRVGTPLHRRLLGLVNPAGSLTRMI
jgi:hypothetical protein